MTMPMTIQRTHDAPIGSRVLAALALVVAVLVLKLLPFRWIKAMAQRIARRYDRNASATEVAACLGAIDASNGWMLGRVACIERSLAAVLMLACYRRSVAWCIGVKTPPLTSHAWVAVGGKAIGEVTSVAEYRIIFSTSG